jgi:hypothetical protein
MSAKSKPLHTRIWQEARFDVCPIITAPFRGPAEARLDALKHDLLQKELRGMRNSELFAKLCWAAQEAAGLAWLTPFPLLVFPELFREKLDTARKSWAKQLQLRRCRELPIAIALAA